MQLAEEWLHKNGYPIVNCSASQPHDFEVQNGSKPIKIEVKGTRPQVTEQMQSLWLETRSMFAQVRRVQRVCYWHRR